MSKSLSPYNIYLTPAQGLKLLQGQGIAYRQKYLSGSGMKNMEAVPFPMSKAFAEKFAKAMASGIMDLELNKAQLQWIANHVAEDLEGTGFWSKLWRGIKKVGKAAWKLGKPFIQPIIRGAADTLGISSAINTAADIANAISPGAGDSINRGVASVAGQPGTGRNLDNQPTVPRANVVPAVWRGPANRFANAVDQTGRDAGEISQMAQRAATAIAEKVREANVPQVSAPVSYIGNGVFIDTYRNGRRARGSGAFTAGEQRR